MTQIPNSNTVFLRPQPSAAPTDYIREQMKAGMMMMASRNLAIYTGKAVANQGPQGEPGEDKNSWYDTIIAAATDHDNPISLGTLRETWRAPYPLDLTSGYIRMSLIDAPIGAAFTIDVLMNGVSMFSTLLTIDDGEDTSVTSTVPAVLSTTYVPDDAKFELVVMNIGTIASGIGLKVAVTGIKTD